MKTLLELFNVNSDFVVDSETTAYVEAQFKNPNSSASKIRETVKTINAHKKALAYYTALLNEMRVYLEARYDELKRIIAREKLMDAKAMPENALTTQATIKKELEKKIQALQSQLTDLNKKIDEAEKALAETEKLKQELIKKHTEEINQKVEEIKIERHTTISELLDSSDEKQNINIEQLEQAAEEIIEERTKKYDSEAARERLLNIVAPKPTPEQSRILSEEEKRALAETVNRNSIQANMSQKLNINTAIELMGLIRMLAPRMGVKLSVAIANAFMQHEEKITLAKMQGPEVYLLTLENIINDLKNDLNQLQSEKVSLANAANNLRTILTSHSASLTFISDFSDESYKTKNPHLRCTGAAKPAEDENEYQIQKVSNPVNKIS